MIRKGIPNKYKTEFHTYRFYAFYVENYIRAVDRTKYAKIWDDFIELMIEAMIAKSYTWTLHNGIGSVKITKFKVKNKFKENGSLDLNRYKKDWKSTYELWDENPELYGKTFVYYTQEHTEGFSYRFNFTPARKFRLYRLKVSRLVRIQLSKRLLSGDVNIDYLCGVARNNKY